MSNRLMISGEYVLVSHSGSLIHNGAIAISEGIVERVGTRTEVEKKGPYEHVHDYPHSIIMPGLVSSHGHGKGVTSPQVGILDAPWERKLFEYYLRMTKLPHGLNARLCAASLLRSGVTTILHQHYGSSPVASNYLEELISTITGYLDVGTRVAMAPSVADSNLLEFEGSIIEGLSIASFLNKMPKDLRKRVEFHEDLGRIRSCYFSAVKSLVEKFKGDSRVRILLGPSDPQWCSDDVLERCRKVSRELRLHVHSHLLETKYQRIYAHRVQKKSYLDRIDDAGLLDEKLGVAHGAWLNSKELTRLSRSRATLVHNPGSNLRSFSGIAPIKHVLASGGRVAIGHDDFTMADDNDFWSEIRLTSILHRLPGIQQYSVPPEAIIKMATVNGAQACGFSHLGLLQRGNHADIVVLDSNRVLYPRPPINASDLCRRLVSRAHGYDVRHVYVCGTKVVDSGQVVTINEQGLREEARNYVQNPTKRSRSEERIIKRLKRYTIMYHDSWDQQWESWYRYNAP